MGSNKHIVDLNAVISLLSSSCPTDVKHCNLPCTAVRGNYWSWNIRCCQRVYIYNCISEALIFSLKKFFKSLLLNCDGQFLLGDVWLFGNLSSVLNKKPWTVLVILYECVQMLNPAFRACLQQGILSFQAFLKTSELVFFHFHSRSREHEYYCCTMAQYFSPWSFFNLIGATVSRILSFYRRLLE